MFCEHCGTQLPDGSTFCSSCGASMSNAQPVSQPIAPTPVVYANPNPQVSYVAQPPIMANRIPVEYEPLSPWAYLGYTLLFAIPIVGLICMIVFACSSTGNINRKNFALSFIYLYVISFVLGIIMGIAGVAILEDIMGSMF